MSKIYVDGQSIVTAAGNSRRMMNAEALLVIENAAAAAGAAAWGCTLGVHAWGRIRSGVMSDSVFHF
jgi:CTP:molybdopterin cytidylyltransferase MocA